MATALLANRVKVGTATTGTGTVTLGAVSTNAFFTFAEAGITDGQLVRYLIEEGLDVEIGVGTYTASGTTLSRDTVHLSKISGTAGTSKMNLAGAATVSIVAAKEDLDVDGFTEDTTPAPITDFHWMWDASAGQKKKVSPANVSLAQLVVPKAIYRATITPTTVTGNISSVDTGTEIITWSTTHGRTTGECVIPLAGTWPTGVTLGTPYYINALSTTTFALYTTLVDALADTNRVNLTAAGSGTRTMRVLVASNVLSYGMAAVGALGGVALGLNVTFEFNISPALASAVALCRLVFTGVGADTAGAYPNDGPIDPVPSAVATNKITYDFSSLPIYDSTVTPVFALPQTWAAQATTSFTVYFTLWGT